YPKEYWNRTAFVTDPTGHLAAAMVLEPNGTAFQAHYGWNLLASDDEWCGPIMAEVGPDGNVWLIDWYAFIVQHNPTPPGFEIGLNAGVIHALWTLHGLGALDGKNEKALAAVVAALGHKSAGVRRNAVAVLPRDTKTAKTTLESGVLGDPDLNVRLAALLALA